MINQQLVEQFTNISTNKLSGSLDIFYGEEKRRYFFEDGQLQLLDLCADKEMVIARCYMEFHKIDEAMYRLAINLYQTQHTRVTETLIKQQLVTEMESGVVSRAMVENVLVSDFSAATLDSFVWKEHDDETLLPYDLDISALKIRIDTDMLLSMAASRIQERESVLEATGAVTTVYSPTGTAGDGVELNEMEAHVLDFIDGQRTINDIAQALRDSDINISCYIHSLVNHGLIRAGTAAQQPVQSAQDNVQPAAPVADAAVAQSSDRTASESGEWPGENIPTDEGSGSRTSAIENFQVYSEVYTTNSGGGQARSLLKILVPAVLILVGIIVMLVVNSQQAKAVVDTLSGQIHTISAEKDWGKLETVINETYDNVQGDVSLEKRLNELLARLRNELFQRKIQVAQTLIDAGRISEANNIIMSLPTTPSRSSRFWDEEIRANILDIQNEFVKGRATEEASIAGISDTIKSLLNSKQIESAVSNAKSVEQEKIKQRAWEVIVRWRSAQMDLAEDPLESLASKARILENVLLTEPTAQEQEKIEALLATVQKEQTHLMAVYEQAQEHFQAGRWDDARGLITKDAINEARGSTLASDMMKLVKKVNETEQRYGKVTNGLRRTLSEGRSVSEIKKRLALLSDLLKNNPDMISTELTAMKNFAQKIVDIYALNNNADSLEQMRTFSDDQSGDEQGYALHHVARLESIRDAAALALADARELIRIKNAEQAKMQYELILTTTEWNGTESQEIAQREIIEAEKLIAQQRGGIEDLQKAMADGDIIKVRLIAERLNIQSLPLYIESHPSGAAVRIEGIDVGSTPVFVPTDFFGQNGLQRSSAQVQIIAEGYKNVSFMSADATGGWQVKVKLRKEASSQYAIGASVMSAVSVDGADALVTGAKATYRINAQGIQQKYDLIDTDTGAHMQAAIYAAPSASSGGILLASRDRLILRIREGGDIQRISAPSMSDYAVSYHSSALILDRESVIAVGLDNTIHAIDIASSDIVWQFKPQSPVALSVIVQEDRAFVAELNGTITMLDVDNGIVLSTAKLDTIITAVWEAERGLAGYAGLSEWTWDGMAEVQKVSLPQEAENGSAGIIITKDKRILVRKKSQNVTDADMEAEQFEAQQGTWETVGRIEGKLQSPPLLWNNHVVCHYSGRVTIIGEQPFDLRTGSAGETSVDYMNPVVVDQSLICVDQSGSVHVFSP